MRTRLIILMMTMMAAFTGCQEFLEVSPQQSTDTEAVLTTADGLEALLTGAYEGLKGTANAAGGGELFGGDFVFFAELLAANTTDYSYHYYTENPGSKYDVFSKSINTYDVMVQSNWARAYQVINSLNMVLAHADAVVTDSLQKAELMGEAYCMRGLLYFEMVRLWALPYRAGMANDQPGLPLRITSVETEAQAVPLARSTVAQVYAQIEADLLQAENLLLGMGSNTGQLSVYAAQAYLARVYLQQGRYTEAANRADAVIASGTYSLAVTPRLAFSNRFAHQEYVVSLAQNEQSNAGTVSSGHSTFFASLPGLGYGELQAYSGYLGRFNAADLRGAAISQLDATAITDIRSMYYMGTGLIALDYGLQDVYFTAKWGDPYAYIPVVRLAEIYLIRAEANLMAGTTTGASPASDLATIMARAGISAIPTGTMDEIKDQRTLELEWEGQLLWDKKRWKEDIASFAYDSPKLILPIPGYEVELSKGLVEQNSGY